MFLLCLYYFVVLLLFLVTASYIWFRWKYGHWKRLSVPYLEPSFPLGCSWKCLTFKTTMVEEFATFYKQLEGHPFGGVFVFDRPILLIRDPETIKTITVKDFANFTDHGVHNDDIGDPFSVNLFNANGRRWRFMRQKTTPAFTSGKMKFMFSTMASCCLSLQDSLRDAGSRGDVVEMRSTLSSFATDVIAQVVFGLDGDSNSEFYEWGVKAFTPGVLKFGALMLSVLHPVIASVFNVPTVSSDVTAYFTDIIKKSIHYREANGITKRDFLQLMIQLKNDGTSVEGINEQEIAAHAFNFFFAGFETSVTTTSFCLFELARNQEIQDKLFQEVNESLEFTEGKLDYEAITTLPYLEKVISETLRKYPPGGTLHRVCTAPEYRLPGSTLVLRKGDAVVISVLGMHWDPQYFPDPEKFNPERFSPEEKDKRYPYSYIPFGEGPRLCIGKRFGQLQIKISLVVLLSMYKFEISDKTVTPFKYDPGAFVLTPINGLWLKITERERK